MNAKDEEYFFKTWPGMVVQMTKSEMSRLDCISDELTIEMVCKVMVFTRYRLKVRIAGFTASHKPEEKDKLALVLHLNGRDRFFMLNFKNAKERQLEILSEIKKHDPLYVYDRQNTSEIVEDAKKAKEEGKLFFKKNPDFWIDVFGN